MSDIQFEISTTVDPALLKAHCDELVGAIDQGTSSSKFLLFTKTGEIAASSQREHKQYFPPNHAGWHEHDAMELWNSVASCITATIRAVRAVSPRVKSQLTIVAIGITNQRETTVCWNSATGQPYHRAIVWDCVRTTGLAAELAQGNVDRLRAKTGLPLASYFAGTKVRWLLENCDALKKDWMDPTERAHIRFGTIDTWLVYQLTGKSPSPKGGGGSIGGMFLTDVSNASRWLFMDLETVSWDESLVETVTGVSNFPMSTALPEIRPSSEVYGGCTLPLLEDVPIASILGDQQAALFGQACFEPGMAKNTYGTGMFLMMHTGPQQVASTHGLLTTVAHKIGKDGPVQYALEGSVSHSGSTIQWLRDQLYIIDGAAESEALAATTKSNDGSYFVPAFAGLFAPHWRSDARACWVGLTATHHKGHLARACLEAAAYQTKEVLDAMQRDSHVQLQSLQVDGGMTQNSLLMQFQADILGNVQVVRPKILETTSMGAAFAAGLAVGVWQSKEEIQKLWAVEKVYRPSMKLVQREKYWKGWQKAVEKSMGWEEGAEVTAQSKKTKNDATMQTIAKAALDEADEEVASGNRMLTLMVVAGLSLAVGFLLGKRK